MRKSSSELVTLTGRAAAAAFAVSFMLDVLDLALGLHAPAAAASGPWPATYLSHHALELTAYGLSIGAVVAFFRLLRDALGGRQPTRLIPTGAEVAAHLAELWKLSDPGDAQPPPAWVHAWLRLLWIWAGAEVLNALLWPRAGRLELLVRLAHLPVALLGTVLCQRLISRAGGEEEAKRNLRGLARAPATPAVQVPQQAAVAAAPPPVVVAVPDQSGTAAACLGCGAATLGARCSTCGAARTAGTFTIERVLASNGWRRTYRAVDASGAAVVLKEIAFDKVPDAATIEAFGREAQIFQRLRHRGIPPLRAGFAEGAGPAQRFYLAHQWVEGTSLDVLLEDGPLPEDEVAGMVDQLLDILVYLQERTPPVIHRDIKPSNIIVRPDGAVALVDFGAARNFQGVVQSATLAGTVGYMPPEQMAGQIDATSDLYAVGATALHLLTGLPPWEMMDGPELRIPQLPVRSALQQFLKQLCHFKRAKRFPSAAAAKAALEKARKTGKSRRILYLAAAALVLTVAFIARWWVEPAPAAATPVAAAEVALPATAAGVLPAAIWPAPLATASLANPAVTANCCRALLEWIENDRRSIPAGAAPSEPNDVYDFYRRSSKRCDEAAQALSPEDAIENVIQTLDDHEVPATCLALRRARSCEPGVTRPCAGDLGCEGTQACDPRGSGYGRCVCQQKTQFCGSNAECVVGQRCTVSKVCGPPDVDDAVLRADLVVGPGGATRGVLVPLDDPKRLLAGIPRRRDEPPVRLMPSGDLVYLRRLPGDRHGYLYKLVPDSLVPDGAAGSWVYPEHPEENDIIFPRVSTCARPVDAFVLQSGTGAPAFMCEAQGRTFTSDAIYDWEDAGGKPLIRHVTKVHSWSRTNRWLVESQVNANRRVEIRDETDLVIPVGAPMDANDSQPWIIIAARADGNSFKVAVQRDADGRTVEAWRISAGGIARRDASYSPLPEGYRANLADGSAALDSKGRLLQVARKDSSPTLVVRRGTGLADAAIVYQDQPGAGGAGSAPGLQLRAQVLLTLQ